MSEKIKEFEMNDEEIKDYMQAKEEDYIAGLLAAADFVDTETQEINIVRDGRKFFSFRIHAISEEMLNDIRKKYTKFAKNRRAGIKVAEEVDQPKYRASIIYNSTVEEDKAKLWDNKQVQEALRAKGKLIMNALDVIDAVLLPGEKDRVMDLIDEFNGFGNEDIKIETAKN